MDRRERYKLKMTIKWIKSKYKDGCLSRIFIWDQKEDALTCKKLLEKADYDSRISMEFVSFTDEIPLEEENGK